MNRRGFIRALLYTTGAMASWSWFKALVWPEPVIAYIDVGDRINGVATVVAVNHKERTITLDRPVSVDANDVIVHAGEGGGHTMWEVT